MDCCSICSLNSSYRKSAYHEKESLFVWGGALVEGREKQKRKWQMAWIIAFLLALAVITHFSWACCVFCTVFLMLLWHTQGRNQSWVSASDGFVFLLDALLQFLWAVLRVVRRKVTSAGLLYSGCSQMLIWISVMVDAKILIWSS